MVLLDVYRLLILVEIRLIPFNRILNSFDSTRNIPNELIRCQHLAEPPVLCISDRGL